MDGTPAVTLSAAAQGFVGPSDGLTVVDNDVPGAAFVDHTFVFGVSGDTIDAADLPFAFGTSTARPLSGRWYRLR